MKLSLELEKKLREAALKQLEKGRTGWDIPHTLNSVEWMKKLIKHEGGNEKILITTMYLHDTGYPNIKKGYNFGTVKKHKAMHAEKGTKIAEEVLKKFKEFSSEEIKIITNLIKHHDDLEGLDTHERQLVFEADNLSKLDVENVTPTFNKENYSKFMKFQKEVRAPLFKTITGKKCLKRLIKKAEEYFQKM